MKLIGLAGKAGAGKDYVYEYLKRNRTEKVGRVAFADGVKLDIEEALALGTQRVTPWDMRADDYKLPALWQKPYSDEVRWLLQHWGTELRRAQDEHYWTRKGMERIDELSTFVDLVVVTDVRFQNEVDVIHAYDGIVAEVTALDYIRASRLAVDLPTLASQDMHPSAIIDFDVDAIIENSGETVFPDVVTDYLTGA